MMKRYSGFTRHVPRGFTSSRAGGFTIIELALAMSFVSLLLIAIATLSIQLTNQYTRGLTLKEISQAGTEASNDIKRTMAQSQVQASGVRLKNVTGGGLVLCTGNYSYIANNPDNLEANNASVIRVGATGTELAARLAKVRNDGGTLCDAASVLDTNKRYATNDVSELISSGSRLLVVRGMTVTPNPAPGTPFYQEFTQGRGIYTVTLTIGTGVGTEFVSNTCRPPSDQLGNLDFCAIDTFAFTTRVGSSNR